MDNIRMNTYGLIKKGEDEGWYIYIKEDLKKTGGYYIFFKKSLDKDSEVYDEWLEDINCVKDYFLESNWEVKWLD